MKEKYFLVIMFIEKMKMEIKDIENVFNYLLKVIILEIKHGSIVDGVKLLVKWCKKNIMI